MMSAYSFLIANFVFGCSVLMIIKGYDFLFIHLVVFSDLDFCHLVASLDSFDQIDEGFMKGSRIGIDLLEGFLDDYMYVSYFDKDSMSSTLLDLQKLLLFFI